MNRLRTFLDRLRGSEAGGEHLPQVAPQAEIDRLTYAIGDVHGRFDLFEKMIASLWFDAQSQGQKGRLVLLGDYVDRGLESNRVLELICSLCDTPAFRKYWPEIIVLRGNHEATLLDFLENADCGPVWAEFGGLATLTSYGIQPPADRNETEDWEAVRLAFLAALPERHLRLLRQSQMIFSAGDYLFVHAGIRPGQPLSEQDEDTFLWIRGAFLKADRAGEQVVVHGHTPDEVVHNAHWRIGLDTGAYATGVLSAVRLVGSTRKIFQIRTDLKS